MLISFLGSLPLGTLNIAAMQISISDSVIQALQFSLGSLLAEMIYVRLSLVAMDWVRKRQLFFRLLEWITLAIVLILAASSFYAAMSPSVKENALLSSPLPKILLGFSMSAVSPAQIPFWFLWSTQLLNSKLLLPTTAQFNLFTAGAGLGSLAGLAVYIHGGKWMITKLKTSNKGLNIFMGIVFILAGLFQLYNMLFKKNA